MKATGIVRRIDDLGRVVIPKEIRRTMHIHEGAPLEIFTNDEGDVIFRKYSPLGEFPQASSQCADALYKVTKFPVFICDRERVASAAGPNRRELIGKKITGELDRVMYERTDLAGDRQIQIADNMPDTINIMVPILASSDVIGCVAMSASQEGTHSYETQKLFAELAATFLGKQVEE